VQSFTVISSRTPFPPRRVDGAGFLDDDGHFLSSSKIVLHFDCFSPFGYVLACKEGDSCEIPFLLSKLGSRAFIAYMIAQIIFLNGCRTQSVKMINLVALSVTVKGVRPISS
jgi:hypothetical protein